jgi:hypothetical protein
MRRFCPLLPALAGVLLLISCGLPSSSHGTYASVSDLNAILGHRTRAIQTGSEHEYVEDIDPSQKAIVQREEMAFQNIRQLHFSEYQFEQDGDDPFGERYPKGTSRNPFGVPVAIPLPLPYDVTGFNVYAYLAMPGVKPTANVYQYLLAQLNGAFRIVGTIQIATPETWANLPWELTPLHVIRSGDVVVVGDSSVPDLSTYAADAVRADAVIRRFWGSRPAPQTSTLFFTSNRLAFTQWFNPWNAANVDGLTFPMYAFQADVGAQTQQYVGGWVTVDLASDLNSRQDAYEVVKHELTHALTSESWKPSVRLSDWVAGTSRWSVEGFATWSEYAESPSGRRNVDDVVAQGVRAGRFAGKLPSDSKFYDTDPATTAFNYYLSSTIFQFIEQKWGAANAVAVYADTVSSPNLGQTSDAYADGMDLENALDQENLVPGSFNDPFWPMWQAYVRSLQ